MFIVGMLSWWYGAGWKSRIFMVRDRLAQVVDYFSFDLLFKTLFSPFRQISAGKVNGPLVMQWRAFVDRLISRIIGAIVRLIIILVGSVWLTLQMIGSVILIVLWGVVPFLPVIGFIMAIAGWVPQWR